MDGLYYVGLDVHKKTVVFCVKRSDGGVVAEATVRARREDLVAFAKGLDRPWVGAMEATLFTGWIYDTLLPHARSLKVGHPLLMRAIGASKKKNDRLDASKIADLLRCDLLPSCYMAPSKLRELRRVLRYRNFLVNIASRLKNKTAGLLMECGADYDNKRLHGKKYFARLLDNLREVPDSVVEMLRFDHCAQRLFEGLQRRLLKELEADDLLRERVERLETIRGVGQTMALTWALEIGEPGRFSSIRRAQSYCGLCSAQRESAGKSARGPLSKQRNKALQTKLIEAAKLAPRWNPQLRAVYEREAERSQRNQATLAVARKLVAYLMAVDKNAQPFEARPQATAAGTAPRTSRRAKSRRTKAITTTASAVS